MSRFNTYHSYSAQVRGVERRFVRIIDRYYPGPPGPSYSGLLDLEPYEADALGKELIEAAKKAHAETERYKLDQEIKLGTMKTAEEAKALANE